VDEVVNRIQNGELWNLTFMHWTEPDQYGHQVGWGSTTYSNMVRDLDVQLGRILDGVRASPVLANQAVVILNADHGGSGSGHSDPTVRFAYTIPFCVWGSGIPAGVDAYTLFNNRGDPGTVRLDYNAKPQPIRNGDSGNLAVSILGLPFIPGSSIIPLMGPPAPELLPISITKTETGITLSWPANTEGYELQAATTLTPVPDWQAVTDGITSDGSTMYCTMTLPNGHSAQFFRLLKR